MEASSSIRRRIGGNSPGGMFSSRRGALTLAAAAAVVAGLLLFVFVQQYKKNATTAVVNTPVYVATKLIPRGTPTSVIAANGLFQRTSVKANAVQLGAIADSSVLHGEVTTTAIYPGQQLTAADFTHAPVTVASQLTGTERAIAIPVDSAHGLIGFVAPGDYVDVLSSFAAGNGHGVVSVLASNVLVLSAPSGGGSGGIAGTGGGNGGGNIVLSVSAKIASQLAFAADNGKVWITLRPPVGALQ